MPAGIEIYSDENSLQISDRSFTFMLAKKTTFTFDAKTAGEKGDVHTTDRQWQGSQMIMPTRMVYTDYFLESPDNFLCFTATKCSGRGNQGVTYDKTDTDSSKGGATDTAQAKYFVNPPYVVAMTKKDHEQFGDLHYELYCNVFDPSRMGSDTITITVFEFSLRPKKTGNYGLQVFADDGMLLYDSSNPVLRIAKSTDIAMTEYDSGNNWTYGKLVLHTDYYDHEAWKVVGGCNIGSVRANREDILSRSGMVNVYRNLYCFSTNQSICITLTTRKAKGSNYSQLDVYSMLQFRLRTMYADLTNY